MIIIFYIGTFQYPSTDTDKYFVQIRRSEFELELSPLCAKDRLVIDNVAPPGGSGGDPDDADNVDDEVTLCGTLSDPLKTYFINPEAETESEESTIFTSRMRFTFDDTNSAYLGFKFKVCVPQ